MSNAMYGVTEVPFEYNWATTRLLVFLYCTYPEAEIDEHPDDAIDSDQEVVAVPSGLPVAARGESNQLHHHLDHEDQRAASAHKS